MKTLAGLPKRHAIRFRHGEESRPIRTCLSLLCGALLKIDIETKAVISHIPKAVPKTFNDMEEAARAMKERDVRKESIFQQSVEAQKNSSDLLEKKFHASPAQGQGNTRYRQAAARLRPRLTEPRDRKTTSAGTSRLSRPFEHICPE